MKKISAALLAAFLGIMALAAFAQQGSIQGTLLPSAARTATTNSTDRDNPGNRGVHVIVNVSAYTSGTMTPIVQGKNPITAVYYNICSGAGITSTGVVVLKVYPGVTTATGVCSDAIPKTWRFQMLGAATSTYSVGFFAIP